MSETLEILEANRVTATKLVIVFSDGTSALFNPNELAALKPLRTAANASSGEGQSIVRHGEP